MTDRIYEAIKKQQQWVKYPQARDILTRLIIDELDLAARQGKKGFFNNKGILYVPFTGCENEPFHD